MFPLRQIIALVRAYHRCELIAVSEHPNQHSVVDYLIIPEGWYSAESAPQLEIYWRAK